MSVKADAYEGLQLCTSLPKQSGDWTAYQNRRPHYAHHPDRLHNSPNLFNCNICNINLISWPVPVYYLFPARYPPFTFTHIIYFYIHIIIEKSQKHNKKQANESFHSPACSYCKICFYIFSVTSLKTPQNTFQSNTPPPAASWRIFHTESPVRRW